MANEPKSNSGEWQMPEPIFRSSEGRTPKPARRFDDTEEVDTLSPDFSEADTDEIDVDSPNQDEIDTETPESEEPKSAVYEEQPPARNAVRAVAEKEAGGCMKTITLIVGTITISLIAVIIAVIYFGFFYQPSDRTF